MKTIFIINPKAGKGVNVERLMKGINTVSAELSADTEVYLTVSKGDASRFVREYCQSGMARFIACGGDGTLGEVVNGAMDYHGCEIGVIPIGTGNDFCRNFSGYDFADIAAQITGSTVKCDAIKYTTEVGGIEKSGYSVNMLNIGFDCNVADLTATVKEKTAAKGSFAYFLSILITMIKKKGADLEIMLDGEVKHKGALLLTSLANGSFCGGGIMSNPLAEINDGFININIIRDVPRYRFATLLPHYMKGTHLGIKNIDKVIICKNCKEITIIPKDNKIRMSNDGEIIDIGKTHFEIVPRAFNFVLPSLIEKNFGKTEECLSI